MSTRAGIRASWRAALLRVAISAGLLSAILWWLPWPTLAGAVARVPAGVWLLVVLAFLAGHVVSALKWRLLVRATGVPLGVSLALRAHGLGLFANLCLPSLVGGDLVRAGLAIREHGRAEAVALASLGDRVNDTLALVLLAGAGALACGGAGDGLALDVLLGFAVLLPASVLAALAIVPRLPTARLPGVLARVILRVREARDALLARPGQEAAAFALSLGIQGAFVLLNVRLAAAVGIDRPAAVWLLAWPMAKLIALVPISLGGLGVRELALATLLAPFGVEAALAVAQSLSWQVVLVGSGLVAGAAAWTAGRHRAPIHPAPGEERS